METETKPTKQRKLRLVCVSDTHNHGPPSGFQLPKGDILIHAGDLTNQGTYGELRKAFSWLQDADFGVKIVIAGNHDLSLDTSYTPHDPRGWSVTADRQQECLDLIHSVPGLIYLDHESTTIRLPTLSQEDNDEDKSNSIIIFGSPFSELDESKHQNWAFQYSPEQADEIWSAIPANTDILITHTPPAGHCDSSHHWIHGGCAALLKRISQVRPALHICGHCHEGRGAQVIRWSEPSFEGEVEVESVRTWEDPGAASRKQSLFDLTGSKGGIELIRGSETAVINASIMGKSWKREGKERGKVFNKPIVVDVYL